MRAVRPHRPLPAIHPLACPCRACAPRRQLRARVRVWLRQPITPANRWAFETFFGLTLGLIVAWIVDRAIGGPGILIIFGVGS